jgi:hypothetical protein
MTVALAESINAPARIFPNPPLRFSLQPSVRNLCYFLFFAFFQRHPKDFKRCRPCSLCKANALAGFMVSSRHDSQLHLYLPDLPQLPMNPLSESPTPDSPDSLIFFRMRSPTRHLSGPTAGADRRNYCRPRVRRLPFATCASRKPPGMLTSFLPSAGLQYR